MTPPLLIKEISQRTGIPESKVRASVFDFSRDVNSIISRKSTGGFMIPNIGYVAASMKWTVQFIELKLKNMEHVVAKRPDMFANPGVYRSIFCGYIDDVFACLTLISENEHIKNGDYNCKSAGKKVEVSKESIAEYYRRVLVIIDKFPVELQRGKYPEIQKIVMRKLHKQGILQIPEYKNSQVQPMLVRYKR